MKKIILIFALIFFFSAKDAIASDIPGVQTPIPIIRNMLGNGDFETGNAEGWKFGNLNRAVYRGWAQSGSYFLDTSNCGNCPSEFGNDKTLAYDVNGNFSTGQKYSASVYFRSPQGGNVRLALWELGNKAELLGIFDLVGNADWQKMEINDVAIRNGENEILRVQIYINNIADNINYSFDNFVLNQGETGSCPTSYYTYQQPLRADAPTLADLFDGKAHFQNLQESQKLSLQFDSSMIETEYANGQPSKLPILYNQDDGKYYTFSRAYGRSKHFNMYLMSSMDGVNFTQVAPIFNQSVIQQMGDMYDGQIAIDYSACPTKYVMALECSGQMCVSYSTTPFIPSSWSRPKVIVHFILDSRDGHNANKESASTGVFLIDGNNKYASWTVLAGGPIDASWGVDPNDGVFKKLRDMGTESTYSRAIATDDFLTDLGSSNIGNVVLPAETNTHCTSSWDCNNRDKQDWKKEGNYYYLMYNGANYYGCLRFPDDRQYTNDWGIGIVRSTNPLGNYDLNGIGKIIDSPFKNVCSVGYPVINNVGGELYMYYAAGAWQQAWEARSELVWNSPTPTPTPTPPPSLSLSPGWNQITWPDVSSYTASSVLSDIDNDCGPGTAIIIAGKKKDWWENYVKNYGGESFNLQNNQNYFINVSKNCSWGP